MGNSGTPVDWGKRGAIAGIIAIPIAIVGIIAQCSTSSNSSSSQAGSGPSSVTGSIVSTSVTASANPSAGGPAATSKRPTASATTVAIAPIDTINIEIVALQGDKLGPLKFGFHGNLDFGVGYSWTALADDVKVSGNACQIKAQVTGAQTFPAIRMDECSHTVGSGFSGDKASERITVPGTYTITVTEELSGVTGSTTFTVER
ncbi:hypothetical protein [Nocardia wallacei]|uniref:hypothetical protein n=1 Tax=Nocardia wallacei TaxID=480035 RepID=UPI002453B50B|nr:hypothetical protein [Nocardia wallacei]